MTQTKYLIFQCRGDRQAYANRIKAAVKQNGMSMAIPLIKFERGQERQFYLGLGVQVADLATTHPPPEIIRFCRDFAGLPTPLGLVAASEITSSFMGGNIAWESFNDSIRFEPLPIVPPDEMELVEVEPSHEPETDTWDHLLWWCSAQGEASQSLMRHVIELLFEGAQAKTWPIMRRLTVLGHIETNGFGQAMRWCANEPTFVGMNDGRAFLLGRQSPRNLEKIGEIIGIERVAPDAGPTIIMCQTNEAVAHSGELNALGIAFVGNPALAWARLLPNWEVFVSRLERDPDVREHSDTFRPWDGHEFGNAGPRRPGPGLYEITGERQQDKRTRLFDGHEWLAGPFYDLQWCLSRLRGDDMYAVLRPDGMLLLPEPERWPFLYERALVLCSGRLPGRFQDGDHYYLGYKGVGLEAATGFCGKLGIKLKREPKE